MRAGLRRRCRARRAVAPPLHQSANLMTKDQARRIAELEPTGNCGFDLASKSGAASDSRLSAKSVYNQWVI
jgi:hypothetical protein